MTYKLIKDPRTGKTDKCIKDTDSTNVVRFIPYSEDNADYQEYLKWVDEGNTAEAAD